MLARNHPRTTNHNENDNPSLAYDLAIWALWSIPIHPVGLTLFGVAVWLGYPTVGAVLLVVEVLVLLVNPPFLPGWVRSWNRAMRFRRKFHRVWTSIVKAQHDTTLQAGGFIPLLSVFPRLEGSTATWKVRPPQAATLEYVTEQAQIIAAQYPPVSEITIEYRKATDSIGAFTVTFGDPFTQTQTPKWATNTTNP